MRNYRKIAVLAIGFVVWLNFGYAQTLGGIHLVFPEDGHELTLREDKVFTWYSPDNLQTDQDYWYIMRIVKMDEADNPETAINDTAYFYYVSDTITIPRIWFENLESLHFASGLHFAWQVKAYSADTLFAQSNVNRFNAPPPYEYFWSGNHQVFTTDFTKIDPQWDSLCGTGHTKIFNQSTPKTVPIYFENIKIERSGSRLIHKGGTVHASFKDTLNLASNQEGTSITIPLYLDSLILISGGEKSMGNFNPQCIIDDDTLEYQINQWISLDASDAPKGNIYLDETVLRRGNFIYEIDSTSYISYTKNAYSTNLRGTIKYKYSNDTLKIPIPSSGDISYFNTTFIDTFNITNQLGVSVSTAIIDCNNNKSPQAFSDSSQWKGFYFDKFKIHEIKKDSTFIFNLGYNSEFEAIKQDSSHAIMYISDKKLKLDIDTSYQYNLHGEYNYFQTYYNKLKINNLHDSLECFIDGKINIPYFNNPQSFKIISVGDSILLADLDNSYEFNLSPLYMFELREFAVVVGNDTFPGIINHNMKTITIKIPPVDDKQSIYPLFKISANEISLNENSIYMGEKGKLTNWGYDNIADSYKLKISSYKYETIEYLLLAMTDESLDARSLEEDNTVCIFPNPVENTLTISGLQIGSIISLMDMNGRIVLKQITNKQIVTLNTSNLKSGIYFLKIENKGKYISRKIIKP